MIGANCTCGTGYGSTCPLHSKQPSSEVAILRACLDEIIVALEPEQWSTKTDAEATAAIVAEIKRLRASRPAGEE